MRGKEKIIKTIEKLNIVFLIDMYNLINMYICKVKEEKVFDIFNTIVQSS